MTIGDPLLPSRGGADTSVWPLSIAALGVVFGDIGTSPLYAFRESLSQEHDFGVTTPNVLGVLSLMFWSLIVVITLKYLVVVMRADNHGEGGILALAALLNGPEKTRRRLVLLGLFGTALLYGDGMITPAISVLSAVEGIQVASPGVEQWVLPASAVILIGLFSIQRRGTASIGRLFGPVMGLWFVVLAVLGTRQVILEPSVIRALSPHHAVRFFVDNGPRGFLVLGSVFLVVTGGEALYADMGHFGRRPIELGWFLVALPALVLNYLGQGALLLRDPSAIENPFFLLAPSWAQWPLTALATAAAIIASQALITGAFSLSVQAVNLGYLPRMGSVQTSEQHRGQVYVPAVNWFLLAACLALVFAFGSSARLAGAYGVAVTVTMIITTILVASIARHRWQWSLRRILAVFVPLALIDAAFAGANLFKIPAGGWFPLAVGVVGFTIFTTWSTGRRLTAERAERTRLSVEALVTTMRSHPPSRLNGTGVYLHRRPGHVPSALLSNLRHTHALHEHVVLLSVLTLERPHAHRAERHSITVHPLGFVEIEMRYGFMDHPTLGEDLENLTLGTVQFEPATTTYFLSRESVLVTGVSELAPWRTRIFAILNRNIGDRAAEYGLPRDSVVDIGSHVEL